MTADVKYPIPTSVIVLMGVCLQLFPWCDGRSGCEGSSELQRTLLTDFLYPWKKSERKKLRSDQKCSLHLLPGLILNISKIDEKVKENSDIRIILGAKVRLKLL